MLDVDDLEYLNSCVLGGANPMLALEDRRRALKLLRTEKPAHVPEDEFAVSITSLCHLDRLPEHICVQGKLVLKDLDRLTRGPD
mmetsp:Transcript_8836/g.16217  ORF Transcript_8836/g.16217 Transcript_8836/m.16217 type:complete len:84 (+) Transcript_8836:206-457(+)